MSEPFDKKQESPSSFENWNQISAKDEKKVSSPDPSGDAPAGVVGKVDANGEFDPYDGLKIPVKKAVDSIEPPPSDPKPKRSWPIALICILLGVVIALMLVLIILFMKNGNKSAGSAAEETAPVVTEAPAPTETAAAETLPAETAAAETAAAETEAAVETVAAAVRVEAEHSIDSNQEYMTLTGYDANGAQVWSFGTGSYELMQCDRIAYLDTFGDRFCYTEDGTVKCCSVADGSLIWSNDDFQGSAPCWCYGSDGTLYLCGYMGPDLLVINPNGVTLNRFDSLTESYYWPYEISLGDSCLNITYENDGTGGGPVSVTVSLPDYTVVTPGSTSASGETAYADNSHISGSSCSSQLASSGSNSYSPSNAFDGSLSTAWVEGDDGDGIGASLTINFDGTYHVTGLSVYNGYQKNQDIYNKNSRICDASLTFSDGTSIDITLDDVMGEQTLTLPGDIYTSSVTLTIRSVYPGSKYTDTCLSEIEVY